MYKLLSKIVAKFPSIMGPCQGAFVHNIQTMDGVLFANELIDGTKWSKNAGVIFKIVLENTYDHVEWSFVDYMLWRFGFGEKWCSWIRECISSTSFSVLVNGSPSRLFRASRGLRRGNPLSPFLCTIVAEALSALLSKAKDCCLIEGFEVGRGAKVITHLLFVDGTIIFSGEGGIPKGNCI